SAAASQATDVDPSRFAFVVLSDTPALPSIFEHALAQYVAKGGSVLIALGANARAHAAIPIWGGAVKAARNYARDGDPANVGQVDFSDPALEQSRLGGSEVSGGGGSGDRKRARGRKAERRHSAAARQAGGGRPRAAVHVGAGQFDQRPAAAPGFRAV